jgi:hypothetical protein
MAYHLMARPAQNRGNIDNLIVSLISGKRKSSQRPSGAGQQKSPDDGRQQSQKDDPNDGPEWPIRPSCR